MASFYVIRGKDNGQHYPIRGSVATIGREASTQIRLRDTEVSRNHAKVIRTENAGHEIVDNGSSNGTYVNSRRIDRKELQSGDRVQVGRTLMIYTGGPEPQPSRAVSHVEIVADLKPSQLSQIRSSLDSPLVVQQRTPPEPLAALVTSPDNLPAEEKSDQPSANDLSSNDWEIVYRVGQTISRTGDLNDLLAQVLELIFHWIACDRSCLLMVDDVTGQLMPTHSRDARATALGHDKVVRPLKISRTILEHVVSTREGVLTSNAQDDSRWENVESIADQGVQEAICVPMLGRYGLVGAIYVDTTMSAGMYAERHGKTLFDEQHLKLMLAIAGQAALAIEDTQFYRAMLQSERLAAMGQTIANLSHHVKNILQGVRGGAYLVDDGLKKRDLSVIQRGWSIVERNQERISNLVMDMLSFSKDREPELTRGDLRQLVDDVIELMLSRAQELSVDLKWKRPEQPIMVEFDAEALHRAVMNVVTNAIDAAGQTLQQQQQSPGQSRGEVTVSVVLSQLKNRVSLLVADNGPGIPTEDLVRIFSPFESNKGARGTGLGLPVSQKVLREHGGDIEVQSRSGEGTVFSLNWPAMREPTGDGSPSQSDDDWGNRATLMDG
jgi:two-component system NtrC family sensor kinase